MAVYTHVDPDDLAALVARYAIGTVQSCKGIAEGVENSNFLLETTGGRFILTLYEKRVSEGDLPFFVDLLDHLATSGSPVPAMIRDREGIAVQQISGRAACIIQFLPGISLTHPTSAQCEAASAALGAMHRALAGYGETRENSMGHRHWQDVATATGDLDAVRPGLQAIVDDELSYLDTHWPTDLPAHVIHADLFPDNVLMLGDRVTGLIDFYFAASDFRAYDLVITHAAWTFSADGNICDQALAQALMRGYAREIALTDAEIAALPTLARGAALRFLLTRAHDWVHTPADALVTRKDPTPFLARLLRYRAADAANLFAAA
ncbi:MULTISPECIES: homoserine kinase [unclassified Sphingopyxis]|jgi:homoserine kinase type II|uniref:homoserine kinase n=1 Tax=unclassified Sphingopyxis TaxID=2614943 RepID=UPI00286157BA|nr:MULTISPECIES: homoserine kinase [unclassified Sphingopyxis]MDR6831848.1 homoserine kinase type II [Sphingopyxis sp. BE122]MDR7227590.1 homoserine kinase type II [Sphingopyxis sp. BE259]